MQPPLDYVNTIDHLNSVFLFCDSRALLKLKCHNAHISQLHLVSCLLRFRCITFKINHPKRDVCLPKEFHCKLLPSSSFSSSIRVEKWHQQENLYRLLVKYFMILCRTEVTTMGRKRSLTLLKDNLATRRSLQRELILVTF